MTLASEAIRALIRGAGYRVTRALPVWVSFVILAEAVL
jgi:hypothetical protein